MIDVVFGATCTHLPPASWCWPLPANAIDSTSPCARSPISQIAGYFIVSFEPRFPSTHSRSEEHTSELQSRQYLVCRLLLEKKKKKHAISQPKHTAGSTVPDKI